MDLTFGDRGVFQKGFGDDADFVGMAPQADNKIVIAAILRRQDGPRFLVVRLTQSGALDTSFNKTGWTETEAVGPAYPVALLAQPNGELLVAGATAAHNVLCVRYGNDGSVKSQYRGRTLVEMASMDFAADGRLILADLEPDSGPTGFRLRLFRYGTDGVSDTTYGASGGISRERAIQALNFKFLPDGKVFFTVSDMTPLGPSIYRFDADGNPDASFGENGVCKVSPPSNAFYEFYTARVLPNGNILLAGVAGGQGKNSGLAVRLLPNGTPDASFGTNGQLTLKKLFQPYSILLLQNGQLLLSGVLYQDPVRYGIEELSL